jgi:hypothetical protein
MGVLNLASTVHVPPESHVKAKSNEVFRWAEERCEAGDYQTLFATLHADFCAWRTVPCHSKSFATELYRHGIKRSKSGSVRYVIGLRLKGAEV